MSISVACSCGAKLRADDDAAGKTVACPKCKTRLKVPSPSVPSDPPLVPIGPYDPVPESTPPGTKLGYAFLGVVAALAALVLVVVIARKNAAGKLQVAAGQAEHRVEPAPQRPVVNLPRKEEPAQLERPQPPREHLGDERIPGPRAVDVPEIRRPDVLGDPLQLPPAKAAPAVGDPAETTLGKGPEKPVEKPTEKPAEKFGGIRFARGPEEKPAEKPDRKPEVKPPEKPPDKLGKPLLLEQLVLREAVQRREAAAAARTLNDNVIAKVREAHEAERDSWRGKPVKGTAEVSSVSLDCVYLFVNEPDRLRIRGVIAVAKDKDDPILDRLRGGNVVTFQGTLSKQARALGDFTVEGCVFTLKR